MLVLLIACLSLFTASNATLWHKENVAEMQRLKYCFNKEQVSIITSLFPIASPESEKREAVAMNTLGRLVKNGRSFCAALTLTIDSTTLLLQQRLANALVNERIMWNATLDHFVVKSGHARTHCSFLSTKNSEILSPVNKCIDRVLVKSVKALIKKQYQDEENGIY